MRINFHEQIYKWRELVAKKHKLFVIKHSAMKTARIILSYPLQYRGIVNAMHFTVLYLPLTIVNLPLNAWYEGKAPSLMSEQLFQRW